VIKRRTIKVFGFCSFSEGAVFSGEGSYIIQTLANQQKCFLCQNYEVAHQISLFARCFMSDVVIPSFGYLQNL